MIWFCRKSIRNNCNSYLINHNLNKDSIVFEVWWYTWVWADKMIDKYDPNMYIFEPVKEYYNILEKTQKEI